MYRVDRTALGTDLHCVKAAKLPISFIVSFHINSLFTVGKWLRYVLVQKQLVNLLVAQNL